MHVTEQKIEFELNYHYNEKTWIWSDNEKIWIWSYNEQIWKKWRREKACAMLNKHHCWLAQYEQADWFKTLNTS